MIHLVSDHRSVTAHFRFPCGENQGVRNNEVRENIITNIHDARDNPHLWKQAKITSPHHEIRKSKMNLERGSLASMKQQQLRVQ